MNRKRMWILAVAAALTIAALGVAAVQARPSAAAASDPACAAAITPLSPAEAQGLAFMREEEKLARDAYAALGAQYSLRVFTNIAASESTHMSAVKRLMDRYAVADPVGTNGPGVFEDAALQDLFTQLTAQGGSSLTAALEVGIAIEMKDIADLQARSSATTHADLKRVYSNLLRASQNHLRAFERLLARYGG